MSDDPSAAPPAQDPAGMRFPSLAAVEAAHADLLRRQREPGDASAWLDAATDFLRHGPAVGALLDADDDRRAAQSIFDYWTARLYRAGQDPPDSTLAAFDPLLAPELPDALCPYLGLDAFREADHEKFFGRRDLVAKLVERLANYPLLAVVGPSGAGKSSLVRAGLIPALKAGALPGSQGWRYPPPIVPGSDPPASLARLDLASGDAPVVISVDQFEEVFTLCEDAAAREAFIGALLGLLSAPGAQNCVILTMRSDFETFIARVPSLQPLFEQGRVQVTPLSAGELRDAIEQPAARVGLKFEAGVVDALLQEILGEPAALPLLQFTLLKLWENRERNRVTWAAYRRVGGGRLALARSADAFYAALIPEEQTTARRILLRMVRPGEGLEITSGRVRRSELYRGGEDPGRVERVLEKLLAARLVRLTPGDTPEDDQVEVAHEALVRNWPTLVDWLEEEKAAIATRRRLEGRAAEWVRLGQGASGLLDEGELREAERWLAGSEAAYLGYNPALPELVAASRAALAASARRQILTTNRLRLLTLGLVIALVAALATTVFAFGQSNQAKEDALARETAEVDAQNQASTALSESKAAQAALDLLLSKANSSTTTPQATTVSASETIVPTVVVPTAPPRPTSSAGGSAPATFVGEIYNTSIDKNARCGASFDSSIYGNVMGADGRGVAGAVVQVSDTGGKSSFRVMTTSNGSYIVTTLGCTTWTVRLLSAPPFPGGIQSNTVTVENLNGGKLTAAEVRFIQQP